MIANTVPWEGRVVVSAVVAVFVLLVGVPSAFGHTSPDFEDVPEGHVAETAIRWAAENGVTVGVGNNRFGVGETLTRYQMVTFLCRAFDPGNCQSGVRGSESFVDVPADHWANYSVGWAVNRGITSGVSTTEFGGVQTLTREQMITFLYRAEGSSTGGSDGIDVFQDAPDRSHWASLAIGWAYDQGVTGGIGAGTFGFGTNVSREEMVLFLCRTAAPGTCQPSQQPLPSSVVPTTNAAKPGTAKTPDAGALLRPDEAALPTPALQARTGFLTMPVFICAPAGEYTDEDLEAKVTELNTRVGGFFRRISSQLWNVVFTEGGIVSPDLQWDGLSFEDIYLQSRLGQDIPCADAALDRSTTSRILILTEAQTAPLACGPSSAVSWSGGPILIPTKENWYVHFASWFPGFELSEIPEWARGTYDGSERYLGGLAHEIARYELGIRHLPNMGLLQTVWDSFVYGGVDMGSLPCVYREQLGWPVGGNSPPCHRFGPSTPEAFVALPTAEGSKLTWESPSFTDGAPVTGYTVEVRKGDAPYREYDIMGRARSHVFEDLPVGRYSYFLRAITRYGVGATGFRGVDFVPSPESVQVSSVTSGTIEVSWDPVPGASEYLVWNSGDDPPDILEVDEDGGILESYGGMVVRGSTKLVLHNRQPDTEYTIKVRACGFQEVFGSEECSFGTEVTVTTTPPEPGATAPGAVSSVSITEAGDDWLVLSWDPVPGATYYECGYLTGQNTWLDLGTANTSCELWWDSRRVPAGIGLVAGTTYTVGVKACQKPSVMCSDWTTATASTQVLAAAPATYPLSVKEVGNTSFTLAWSPPAADAYYDLRVVSGLSRTFRVTGRTRDVTVPRLQPNTSYTAKVRTCRGTGGNCSSWVTIPVATGRGS